jgi:hypothetical protein
MPVGFAPVLHFGARFSPATVQPVALPHGSSDTSHPTRREASTRDVAEGSPGLPRDRAGTEDVPSESRGAPGRPETTQAQAGQTFKPVPVTDRAVLIPADSARDAGASTGWATRTDAEPYSAPATDASPWQTQVRQEAWGVLLEIVRQPGPTLTFVAVAIAGLSLAGFGWLRARQTMVAPLPPLETMREVQPSPPLPSSASGRAEAEDLLENARAFFDHVTRLASQMPSGDALQEVVADELQSVTRILRSPDLTAAVAGSNWPFVRSAAVQILTDLERIRRVVQSANEAAAASSRYGAVPTNRDEALSLLGVNADASEKVIKKIVDAMRQSWHPDLARNEADRRAREERMKQINGAWDLLRGHQVRA